jgi:hypothetical protein
LCGHPLPRNAGQLIWSISMIGLREVSVRTQGTVLVELPPDQCSVTGRMAVGSASLQVRAAACWHSGCGDRRASPACSSCGADPTRPGAILNEDSTVNSAGNQARRGSVVQVFATGYGRMRSARVPRGEAATTLRRSAWSLRRVAIERPGRMLRGPIRFRGYPAGGFSNRNTLGGKANAGVWL